MDVLSAKLERTGTAVLPVSFATAWQCINGIVRLEVGESIIIHGGTSSILNVTIQVSEYLGAETFAKITADIRKNTLVETYGIPESNILHYNDEGNFVAAMKRLDNRGVDVVFNDHSSNKESFLALWDLIK
ncbi:hypothetical protein EYC80_009843 [Monilinia laxa]|uniref:Uncharacterized protein n=1 Tax=Monilinia laxa TaxID=61186 RepID=A0A5N6JTG7_MONLA|nr:hypothetical protein EYC80_009843 [Monilinia laxa]